MESVSWKYVREALENVDQSWKDINELLDSASFLNFLLGVCGILAVVTNKNLCLEQNFCTHWSHCRCKSKEEILFKALSW